MANYQNLKAAISAAIRTNGNQEITGQVLQDVLNSIVSVIGANYTFAGVATPATNPGTPDQNVMYLAMEGGTYTNFNGTVLPAGISLLMWNGTWTSETVMSGDGGVFDISVYKSSGGTLATYADLSAALDGGNNVPVGVRKGGMSVKFVQTYDNKYIQFRYMGTVTTGSPNPFLDTANWQGADEVLVKDSKNIAMSGAVVQLVNEAVGLPNIYKAGSTNFEYSIEQGKTYMFYNSETFPVNIFARETTSSSNVIIKQNLAAKSFYLYTADGNYNYLRFSSSSAFTTGIYVWNNDSLLTQIHIINGKISSINAVLANKKNTPIYNSDDLITSGGVHATLQKYGYYNGALAQSVRKDFNASGGDTLHVKITGSKGTGIGLELNNVLVGRVLIPDDYVGETYETDYVLPSNVDKIYGSYGAVTVEVYSSRPDIKKIDKKIEDIQIAPNIINVELRDGNNVWIDNVGSAIASTTSSINTQKNSLKYIDVQPGYHYFLVSKMPSTSTRSNVVFTDINGIIVSAIKFGDTPYKDIVVPEGAYRMYLNMSSESPFELVKGKYKAKEVLTIDEICEGYALITGNEEMTIDSNKVGITRYIDVRSVVAIEVPVIKSSFEYRAIFYDATKTPISGTEVVQNDSTTAGFVTALVPSNAYYVRFNSNTITFIKDNPTSTPWKDITLYYMDADVLSPTGKRPYQSDFIFFSQRVSQKMNDFWNTDVDNVDYEEDIKSTTGVVVLPDNYDKDGDPSPVIIYFHGSSHGVRYGRWSSTDNARAQRRYWASLGFAVIDCNGARNSRTPIRGMGCPQQVRAFRQCFDYVREHYNVSDNVYVVGGSGGGLDAIAYCRAYKNVLAFCALEPNMYVKDSWFDPNVDHSAFFLYYGFNNGVEVTDTSYYIEANYESDKMIGYDLHDKLHDNVISEFPCPIKLWAAQSSGNFVDFINALRAGGNTAFYRQMPGLTHSEIVSGHTLAVDNDVVDFCKLF